MVRDASSARSDQSELTGPNTEHHQHRLSRRIVAQASAQSMERDDCDVRTEYGLLDERPVINGIRGEEVTEVRSSIHLDAEEVCQGPSPWDSFGALVKTKVPARGRTSKQNARAPKHAALPKVDASRLYLANGDPRGRRAF